MPKSWDDLEKTFLNRTVEFEAELNQLNAHTAESGLFIRIDEDTKRELKEKGFDLDGVVRVTIMKIG